MTTNSSKPLFWIRYEFEQDGKRLTDTAEFHNREAMDLALARLHVYTGTDFILAAAGERPWPDGYYPEQPRSWRKFLTALERGLDRNRVAKGEIPLPPQEPKTIAGETLRLCAFVIGGCTIAAILFKALR